RGRERQDVWLDGARPGEARFEFRAKAADSARFTFTARAGREADAVAIAVPVKPFYHPLAQTVAGLLAGTASVEVVLDDEVGPARSVLESGCGSSPLAALACACCDLRLSPFACTVQVSADVLA